AVLNRLVARGLVMIAGFTPSDAAHVLGLQSNWDGEAAELGAALFARRRDRLGQPIAPDGATLAQEVLTAVTRASALALFQSAFDEDGLDGATVAQHELVRRALDGACGVARIGLTLDRPVIGLGASAALHYASLDRLVGQQVALPADADVANALGAVVGQVRLQVEVVVTQPQPGLFRLTTAGGVRDFHDEERAMQAAEAEARETALARAATAGADAAQVELARGVNVSIADGQRIFLEARVTAIASGRPRIT
ncbi:hydantoinase, partial [Salmonella enterica subsp. enterica serovar Java]|nr:hydantoinase [Salmonella enterica subsp. enterica serovar Java]